MTTRIPTHAIVVGGGCTGLIAAAAIASRVTSVTVLERELLDRPGMTAAPRWPACHLPSGTVALVESRLPGITADLLRAGAVPLADAHTPAPTPSRRPLTPGLAMSERLLVATLRRALARAEGCITIADGTRALGAVTDGARVCGVRTGAATHEAELVIDATGTAATIHDDVAERHGTNIPVSTVPLNMTYRTLTLSHLAGVAPGQHWWFDDPHRGRTVVRLLPLEGRRWALTVGTWKLDDAPATVHGFAHVLRAVGHQRLAHAVAMATVTGPLTQGHCASTRLRHLDRTPTLPAGLLTVGAAMCAMDPLRHGAVPLALGQALLLERALSLLEPHSADLPQLFHSWAARQAVSPWRVASGADLVAARPRGPLPARVRRSVMAAPDSAQSGPRAGAR